MEVGLGVLGLAPDAFWSMTFAEFTAATDGWEEKNTGKRPAKPLDADDFRTLAEDEEPERIGKEARRLLKDHGRRN